MYNNPWSRPTNVLFVTVPNWVPDLLQVLPSLVLNPCCTKQPKGQPLELLSDQQYVEMLHGAATIWDGYVRDKRAGRQPQSQLPWADLALQLVAAEQRGEPAGPPSSISTAAEPPTGEESGAAHACQSSRPQRDAGDQQEASQSTSWHTADEDDSGDSLLQDLAESMAPEGAWTGRQDWMRTAQADSTAWGRFSMLCAWMRLHSFGWLLGGHLSQCGWACRRHLSRMAGIDVKAITSSGGSRLLIVPTVSPAGC